MAYYDCGVLLICIQAYKLLAERSKRPKKSWETMKWAILAHSGPSQKVMVGLRLEPIGTQN